MVTSRWFNWINFLCIFVLSILLFYSYTWVSNYSSYSKAHVTSVVMHRSPIFYLNVLFSVGTCFILDMFVETIKFNLLGMLSAYVRKLVANKGEIVYDRQIQFQKLLLKYEKKFVEEVLKREHYIKRKREVRMKKLKASIEAQLQKDEIKRKLTLNNPNESGNYNKSHEPINGVGVQDLEINNNAE